MLNLSFVQLAMLFWIIMIIFDAIIALTLPPYMTWKRAISKRDEIASKFGVPIADAAYSSLRPKLKKDAKDILQSIETNVGQKIDNNIKVLLTNDIPHMIDDKLDDVREDLRIMHDNIMLKTDELRNGMYRSLGATGQQAKKVKNHERLLVKAYILQNNIQPYANILAGASLLGVSKGEINQMLDVAKYQIAKKMQEQGGTSDGSEASPLSALQTGSWLQEIPSLQTQSQPEESNMGSLDPSKYEELLKRKQEEYKASLNARGDEKGCQEKSETEIEKDEGTSE